MPRLKSTAIKKLPGLFAVVLCSLVLNGAAQPYVDPFHLRYTYAFKSGSGFGTPFRHFYFGPDLPLKLTHDRLLVLSPIYENWDIDSVPHGPALARVSSVGIAVSFIFPLHASKWSLGVSAIPRFNSENLVFKNSFQAGGVLLASYKKRERFTYKVGLYVNREFFGTFIMPLAGIDWRIDKLNNLFGVLPGKLTFEHKIHPHFYTGATFRAITNSYRMLNGNYLRIDDNQLSGFLDAYITKHFVITGEAGYGIMRKLRMGSGHNKIYKLDYSWGDGPFIKISTSYRIRL